MSVVIAVVVAAVAALWLARWHERVADAQAREALRLARWAHQLAVRERDVRVAERKVARARRNLGRAVLVLAARARRDGVESEVAGLVPADAGPVWTGDDEPAAGSAGS